MYIVKAAETKLVQKICTFNVDEIDGSYVNTKMTVATDKLVYDDISPEKTDSFKPVDQFILFLKRCNLSGEIM